MNYDVIIVGAGPAGTSCGFFLAKNGLKVLILEKDKFPREKVCGDCLTPTGVSLTRELGIYSELLKVGKPLEGVRIITRQNTINTTLFIDAGLLNGIVAKRYDLDYLLFKNSEKAGAEIREGAEVVNITAEDNSYLKVEFNSAGKIYSEKSKFVVLACGGGTPLLFKLFKINYKSYRAIGVAIRGYFELKIEAGEFMELLAQPEHWPALGWIFPVDENLVNAGIGFYVNERSKIKDGTLSRVMNTFVQKGWYSSKILKGAKLVSPLKSKRLCMGGLKAMPSIKNIFLVGEAAGLVNPFTGEGIAHALLSGKLASKSILTAIKNNLNYDYASNEYVEMLRKELLSYYKTAIFLRNIARSWTVTDALVEILNKFPPLSAFNIKYWVKA